MKRKLFTLIAAAGFALFTTTAFAQGGPPTNPGTDWPVTVTVRKDGRKWITEQVCNGVCEHQSAYTTQKDAIGAANVIVSKLREDQFSNIPTKATFRATYHGETLGYFDTQEEAEAAIDAARAEDEEA